jgi:hypothetical protein
MHDALRVSGIERVGDLRAELEDLVDGSAPRAMRSFSDCRRAAPSP